MAETTNLTVQVKIADMMQTQGLIAAFSPWAAEVCEKPNPTEAERALLDAAIAFADPYNTKETT